MNFLWVLNQLRNNKKVRRPCWEEDSYWMLGKDETIMWNEKKIAHVHLNQIDAVDWEIFEEEKPKVIILDDNELSILSYAEEFPENWKKICESLDNKKRK